MRILILCTGNSCRSQMAEGFLKSFDKRPEVYSAGTWPADIVNPKTIEVMNEVGIFIRDNRPQSVDEFIDENFDFVITVCDSAKESCPAFIGDVKHLLHIGFEDPAEAIGTDKEILDTYRRIRNEIKNEFLRFYDEHLKDYGK